jgi:hypothetical protein
MIYLGTARLSDANGDWYQVYAALRWQASGDFGGVLGGTIAWEALAGQELVLELPGGSRVDPVRTEVVIDAIGDRGNEVDVRGRVLRPGHPTLPCPPVIHRPRPGGGIVRGHPRSMTATTS